MEDIRPHTSDRQIRHLAAVWLQMGIEPLEKPRKELWAIGRAYVPLLSTWADNWTEEADEVVRRARANFIDIMGDYPLVSRGGQIIYNALAGAAERDTTRLALVALESEELRYSDSHALTEWRTRSGKVLVNLLGQGWEFSPTWRTSTAVALAGQIYKHAEWDTCPVLADALQDAGMPENHKAIRYLRSDEQKFRGCWVLDQILGKE
jgi:hypothetical protein